MVGGLFNKASQQALDAVHLSTAIAGAKPHVGKGGPDEPADKPAPNAVEKSR